MDYIFGSTTLHGLETENVKSIGSEHSYLSGACETVRYYDDTVITDNFEVVEKYNSFEDSEGNCYDFYAIKKHSRKIDFSEKKKQEMTEKDNAIDELLVLLLEGGAVNG